ncbi:MAG TPA: hypothetical protein VJ924_15940 [Alphaproteobacteria bacterium]|nr:hypothetical protein [Alphaproteobacteria bacterium]
MPRSPAFNPSHAVSADKTQRRARRRRVVACLAAALSATWIYAEANDRTFPIISPVADLAPIVHDSGYAFTAPLGFGWFTERRLQRLPTVLFEGTVRRTRPLERLDPFLGWSLVHRHLERMIEQRFPGWSRVTWRPIGIAKQTPDDVRTIGHGRYLVWQRQIIFSTLENDDPATNGRKYRLQLLLRLPSWAHGLIGALALLFGAIWAWPALRRVGPRSALYRALAPGTFVTAVMLVAMFVMAEAYFYVTTPFTKTAWPSRFDPVAGFIFEPNATVRWTNHFDYWTAEKTNSLGFLDREPAIPKPPGTFRILILGDSFVEAAQVPIRHKLQALLETTLRRRFPERRIDVVAMGYSGAGQSNVLSFYEAFGERVRPDLVINIVVANDLANNSPLLESIRNGWHPYRAPRLFFERAADGAIQRNDIDPDWASHKLPPATGDAQHDYALRLAHLRRDSTLAKRFDGWRFPDDLDMDRMFCAIGTLAPVFEDAIASSRHTFGEFARLGARDGFRNLVVAAENVTTYCARIVGGWRNVRPDLLIARLRGLVAEAGLPFFDLYPAFKAHGLPEAARFLRDGHWSERGHAWAAEAIADYLAKHPELIGQ